MPIPRAMARFNRRVTNRLADAVAWSIPPLAVVLHRGRVSGRLYRTPVGAWPVDGGFVMALSYGSGADWVRNIIAAGRCTLVRSRAVYHLTDPRVLGEEEGMALIPAFVHGPLRVLRTTEFLRMTIDPH